MSLQLAEGKAEADEDTTAEAEGTAKAERPTGGTTDTSACPLETPAPVRCALVLETRAPPLALFARKINRDSIHTRYNSIAVHLYL